MHIRITGRRVEITDALHDFIHKKFPRLARHFDHIISCHVILSVGHKKQSAEATVVLPGAELFAKSEDDSMYTAIDSLVDKLNRQLIKHKEKSQDHNGSGSPKLIEED